jgi:hypothetical protein
VFGPGGGNDTVTDLVIGIDHIHLDGVSVRSATTLDVDHIGSLDTHLRLSSGSITILNTGHLADWHVLLL